MPRPARSRICHMCEKTAVDGKKLSVERVYLGICVTVLARTFDEDEEELELCTACAIGVLSMGDEPYVGIDGKYYLTGVDDDMPERPLIDRSDDVE